jgi:hypothetical protein
VLRHDRLEETRPCAHATPSQALWCFILRVMTARLDPRNGHWYFRKVVRHPDGTSMRLFGVALRSGLPNTEAGAVEAERRAVSRPAVALARDPESSWNRPTVSAGRASASRWVARAAGPARAAGRSLGHRGGSGRRKTKSLEQREATTGLPQTISLRLDWDDWNWWGALYTAANYAFHANVCIALYHTGHSLTNQYVQVRQFRPPRMIATVAGGGAAPRPRRTEGVGGTVAPDARVSPDHVVH